MCPLSEGIHQLEGQEGLHSDSLDSHEDAEGPDNLTFETLATPPRNQYNSAIQ